MTLPNKVPFVQPPAMETISWGTSFATVPVQQPRWNRFSTRAQAQCMCSQIAAAISASQTGAVFTNPLSVSDQLAYEAPPTVLLTPLVPSNPQPGDISIFVVSGYVSINGVEYEINEYAGDLVLRSLVPNPGEGDKNQVQQGEGASAVMVATPGKLAVNLEIYSGIAQIYWALAS